MISSRPHISIIIDIFARLHIAKRHSATGPAGRAKRSILRNHSIEASSDQASPLPSCIGISFLRRALEDTQSMGYVSTFAWTGADHCRLFSTAANCQEPGPPGQPRNELPTPIFEAALRTNRGCGILLETVKFCKCRDWQGTKMSEQLGKGLKYVYGAYTKRGFIPGSLAESADHGKTITGAHGIPLQRLYNPQSWIRCQESRKSTNWRVLLRTHRLRLTRPSKTWQKGNIDYVACLSTTAHVHDALSTQT